MSRWHESRSQFENDVQAASIPLGARKDAPTLQISNDGAAIHEGQHHSPLVPLSAVRISPGTLFDTLELDGARHRVTRRASERVRAAIVDARLGPAPDLGAVGLLTVDKRDVMALRAAIASLGSDETLLGFARTGQKATVKTSLMGETTADEHVLLTSSRAVLFACGVDGTIIEASVDGGKAKDARGTAARLLTLVDKPAHARVLAIALIHLRASGAVASEIAQRLVQSLVDADVSEAVLAKRFLIDKHAQPSQTSSTSSTSSTPPDFAPTPPMRPTGLDEERLRVCRAAAEIASRSKLGGDLKRLADELGLDPFQRQLLVERALEGGASMPSTLRLLDDAVTSLPKQIPALERARAFADLAAHANLAQSPGDAALATERALALLPPVVDEEVLPGRHHVTGALRKEILETRLHAIGNSAAILRAIVTTAPFDIDALSALAQFLRREGAKADAARVDNVIGVLQMNALNVDVTEPASTPLLALSADEKVQLLGEKPKLDPVFVLQGVLADIEAPDVTALLAYCERATSTTAAHYVEAAADAAVLLGMHVPRVFVSRGERATGVRAYEGDPPVLLVGMNHLQDGHMPLGRAAARFTVGAELAHVSLGHARITPEDVWNGILKKGRASLDLALAALPSTGRIGNLKKVVALAAKASGLTKRSPSPASSDALGVPSEAFVDAHRAQEWRADRVGHLLSQDLSASVRSMIHVEPRYLAEHSLFASRGIGAAVTRVDDDGAPLLPELALRLSKLFLFHMSPEFARLSSTIYVRRNAAK